MKFNKYYILLLLETGFVYTQKPQNSMHLCTKNINICTLYAFKNIMLL